MPIEPLAATVYASQLIYEREGFPLWDPYAGPDQPGVEIADVGYVEYGAWRKIFNPSKPLNDPSNKLGTPNGYSQLDIGEIAPRAPLPAKSPIRSRNLKSFGTGVTLSAAGPPYV